MKNSKILTSDLSQEYRIPDALPAYPNKKQSYNIISQLELSPQKREANRKLTISSFSENYHAFSPHRRPQYVTQFNLPTGSAGSQYNNPLTQIGHEATLME
jgi:hypothetical protein